MTSLSVIIPTLNEAQHIGELVASIREQCDVSCEAVVVDGGSSDDTCGLAEAAGARVVRSGKGRGVQMNAGAAVAVGDALLFLHADSSLGDSQLLGSALAAWDKACAEAGSERVAGHFRLSFVRERVSADFSYFYYQEKTALNRPETINGDQGFLLSRGFFGELGGFDESLSFLEDQRLAALICKHGEWVLLPGELKTSARRFEQEGFARRMILSAIIMGLFWTDYRLFFEKAPGIYSKSGDSSLLQMRPLFLFIHRLYMSTGFFRAVRDWIKVGRYVRLNAWQLFFVFDVRRRFLGRSGENVFLRFHDRVFRRATDFYVCDVIAAGLSYCWFLLSWAYFVLVERKS